MRNRTDPIRVAIVDDERLARSRLRRLLAPLSDVRLVAECEDGPAAVDALREQDVDLLFLDIQMPEMSGFDVLQAIGIDRVPAVVFVTAFDEYALDAFDACAMDYLLKPFTRARFSQTMERVRKLLRGSEHRVAGDLRTLLEQVGGPESPRKRLVIKTDKGLTFLDPERIDWIEGADNYVRLHAGDKGFLVRTTMRALLERLDPATFARIHNSAIVNLTRIARATPSGHGELVLLLEGGTEHKVSRTYGPELRRRLKIALP